MERGSKRQEVAATVADRVEDGRWQIHTHARSMMKKREVIQPEVQKILLAGWHQPEYDEWKSEYQSWNYALEGFTVDGR